jgi:hypothetical protein
MRKLIGLSAISRFAGVMMGAWLCGVGPAWAGGGGSDGGVSQVLLQAACDLVGVPAASCPQPPTLTQIILGISGYQNTPPDFVRGPLGSFVFLQGDGLCSVSGAPSPVTGTFLPLCSAFNAVTTVNRLAPSSIALTDLPKLTPLAFQAGSPQAVPVALGSPGANANSFLYPVLTGPNGQHQLDVVLDYPASTATSTPTSFVKGQQVGSFTFPLVILNNDNTETPLTANLSLTAACNGSVNAAPGCLAGTVTVRGIPGTTNPPTFRAAQLGINFGLQLAPSPNSSTPHWIFTFELPVIVTQLSDPAYFGCVLDSTTSVCNSPFTYTFVNQSSGQPTAFSNDDRGFSSSVGRIGVSPYPAPLCPGNVCPAPPPIAYGFCATVAGTPAAATFASIGTEGTVYASSPVGQPQPQCPVTQ